MCGGGPLAMLADGLELGAQGGWGKSGRGGAGRGGPGRGQSMLFRTATPPRSHAPEWRETFELPFFPSLVAMTNVVAEFYLGTAERSAVADPL